IAYCYWRYAGFRRFVTWTWPAPLVFALVFLFFSPIRGLLAETSQSIPDVEVTSSTPVVLIVFDEFPLSTILDESGQINGDRYPNFHSLAQQSTWYRHATTVHHHSRVAVTAILTGALPEPTVVPTLENHPRNLFTLLQSSYRIHAREVLTNLCPGDICTPAVEGETRGLAGVVSDLSVLWLHVVYPEQLAARYLPEIGDRWTGFATNNQEIMEEVMETVRDRQEDVAMETWLEGVSGSGPALHYLHVLIPHTPWRFLPTGQEYDADFFGGIFIDSVGSRWRDGIEYSAQGMQRASLQTAFADRFLGQLIDHLETDGIWDETMLIVVADHGMSFIPDTARRNLELDSNAGAILPIPLFVKYPNQTEGVIDDRLAQTIDVLPTVVDVLGIDLDWDLDGESLRGATTRTNQVVITSDAVISAPDGLFDSAVDLARLNASILGDGSDPYDLYAVGDHRHLVGSRAEPGSTPSAWMATISSAAKFREVHPEAHVIPARVTGSLEGGNGVTPLALAVGQRVVSTTLSYFFPDDQDWRF